MLKVAVIGTGLIATLKHLPAWKRAKDFARVVALCDVDIARAAEVAAKFGIPSTYANTREMYDKERPDIVDVCTPPKTHKALTVEALDALSHVLLEKPMATSLAECDEILAAAQRVNRKVCLAHSDLFYPAFMKARELLERGKIGPLAGMRIFLSTPVDYITSKPDHWAHKLRGGVLGETGPHVVYMTLAFIKPIRHIQIHAQKLLKDYPWSPFEDYRITLAGESAVSSIALTYATRHWAAQLEIWGRDGIITADLESQAVTLYRRGELKPVDVGVSTVKVAADLVRTAASAGLDLATRRYQTTHDLLIQKFSASVRDNTPAPVPPEDGRESIRVLDLLMEDLEKDAVRS